MNISVPSFTVTSFACEALMQLKIEHENQWYTHMFGKIGAL